MCRSLEMQRTKRRQSKGFLSEDVRTLIQKYTLLNAVQSKFYSKIFHTPLFSILIIFPFVLGIYVNLTYKYEIFFWIRDYRIKTSQKYASFYYLVFLACYFLMLQKPHLLMIWFSVVI